MKSTDYNNILYYMLKHVLFLVLCFAYMYQHVFEKFTTNERPKQQEFFDRDNNEELSYFNPPPPPETLLNLIATL